MKNIYLFICLLSLLTTTKMMSQNETLYMWKNGIIINQQSIRTADLDSITFTTPEVLICNQVWATRNVETTTYRNGDPIPQVTDPTEMANLTTGAWCYYNNDPTNGPIYGKLYNWYAVNDPRGLAPIGWHIPTDSEWTILTTCLGGQPVAGGAMKATTLWNAPNTDATNSSGFAALPGGYLGQGTGFFNINEKGFWWSTTELSSTNALLGLLFYDNGSAVIAGDVKYSCMSVRCIKD